ncbi:vitellogenin-6 isoform X1 [Parasteatoda tepidariorum]|uniref:vitellogenin-6 isoform X2 n=2 Tax=Parasteatoda tepidariorum TaxID=114398 RepID=UPI001C721B08|nr:vitellogenin isoform X1 [Parasteatoda tepidariorum]XP_042902861.1 vitellogenin isoform X2 [Parasteatoda tepidariorum]XP_042902862.1 vitellogenin isoform X3 [Parasteatoda tepidariorum]XP_042902863.1 vitellogenin isoform X4 [Parasteatoda tepidariorum]
MFGLVFTLAALAATASASGYVNGREYIYAYKGQIYSGYPRIKPQYSGYAFHAKVIVQPHEDYAVIKVDDTQKAQFNGEFENVFKHPHAYGPMPSHAAFLSNPFKVYRKNGIVTHFEVEAGEPMFSVNLKRGLASLFNLNLEAPETTPTFEDNDIQRSDPDAHYFKVYEQGMLGDCETAYGIEHHPHYRTPYNNIVLNVTKVRNYHKCNSAPNQVYSTFYGHECGAADHEKAHTLHGNAQYHYDIRGYRHHYVIEKIMTVGEVAYSPYPVHGQTVATYTNRFLTLIDEKEVTTPLEMGSDVVTHDSLMYQFEFQKNFKDPVDLKKPHYLFHLTGRKVPVDVIKSQFDELNQVYSDSSYEEKFKDKNFPAKFVELLRSVGTIGYEEIEDLYKKYGDMPKTGSPEQKKYRTLFVDTLAQSGTNPALLFGKFLIENKKLTVDESAYLLAKLPYHIKEVSETLLDGLQQLCDHNNVKKNPKLYMYCLLSFSSIIYDHCVARFHPEGIPPAKNVKTCQPEDAIKYFDHVARLFEQAPDEKSKELFLKAMANIGLREIVPHVRSYVDGSTKSSPFFRSMAMWSIKHVGFRFPDKAREILVPILFNQTENYEARLNAFNMLMMYRPQQYEMEGLARALIFDQDDQFKAYVYSALKSRVNSTHPCDRSISKIALSALRILETHHHQFAKYDYTFSRSNYVAGYDPNYDFGGSTEFAYYASDKGYIPHTMYLGLEDFLGGKSFHGIGLGMRQYGLEKFLDNIIGPEGSLGRRSFFDLFKKRAKRDTDAVEKELNEIKSKINLPVHNYGPILGEIFFSYMGTQRSFFRFDDKTFEDFFKQGRFTIPNIPAMLQRIPEFFYQRFMLTIDQFYVIPSEAGLPIYFDYKQPAYLYYKNKDTSFKVEPGFFAEERGGKFPDHAKFETDGHLAIDKNLFASMGVVMPFDGVIFGAGINRRATLSLPLKLKFDLDYKEKNLNFKWTPVNPHEIYHFKYEPYTYVDSYMNSVAKPLEEGYLPVRRQSRKEMKESFFHDALGHGFDVSARYENEFNDKGSWVRFLFEKDYREKFYYMYANPNFEPYDVDISFTQAAEEPTRELEANFKYQYYGSEFVRPEFGAEGYEDLKSPTDRGELCSCSIEGDIVRRGDRDRKVKVALTWTRDLVRSYHKVNFYYERTPFWKSETRVLKVCGSSSLLYPKYDIAKVATLNTIGIDHTLKGEVKLGFGKDCTSDQKIKIQGDFVTTDEQRHYESKREVPDTPEHYNPYAHFYQACVKDRERGIDFGESCMEYIKLISTVHGYNFHVKHENLSPRFLRVAYRIHNLIKHSLFVYGLHSYADIDPQDHYAPPGEFHLHANFSMRAPVADIMVMKPSTVSRYTHAYIPMYRGLRSYPVFEDMHVKNSFSEVNCKLEGNNVVTFDRYEYSLPPIDCYKVLTRDCSPKEFFTVLATKITHPRYKKAVKVFLGKHKIEALPVSDDSDIIIRVDGKRVSVTNTEPYLHREGEHQHPPLFYVTKRDVYYALHSEKYGLIIEYNGFGIIVQVSPYYRNKLCGLCGNYNGQKYDGYTDDKGCFFENDDAHAYAYSIPSDTCSVPKIEPKCPTEGGFGCTKLRTKVVELSTGKIPQSCFSSEPVAECSSHCKARSLSKKKISFHCLPSKDDSTKEFMRQKEHRIIHEVRRKSKDHEAEVEVPDVCQKV